MTDIIIITSLAVVLGVIIGYLIGVATGNQIGKASVKQIDIAPRELSIDTALLSKWENERRTTKTSTRYVRMDYDNMDTTNNNVEALEIKDYAVTDTDAARGIITMEKEVIIQPKTIENGAAVYIIVEDFDNGKKHNVACFGTEENARAYIKENVNDKYGLACQRWEIGEIRSHEA